MQKFFKDNIVLLLGISLPIVLVIFFILASTLPKFFVENPQYDFLFSDSQYSQVEFVVIDQKVHYRVNPAKVGIGLSVPHIYRYFVATGKVQELAFLPPDISMQKTSGNANGVNTNVVVSIDPNHLPLEEHARDTYKVVSAIGGDKTQLTTPVAELANIKVDSSIFAPDNYKFIGNDGYNHGGSLFLLGAGYYSRERDVIIAKNGRNVSINYNISGKEYYNYPVFIGWVIP